MGIFARRGGGGDLTGSQQQKLAIARAFAMWPEILILDEPAEGIQLNIVKQIEGATVRVNRDLGLGIILVEKNALFACSATDHFLCSTRGASF